MVSARITAFSEPETHAPILSTETSVQNLASLNMPVFRDRLSREGLMPSPSYQPRPSGANDPAVEPSSILTESFIKGGQILCLDSSEWFLRFQFETSAAVQNKAFQREIHWLM